MLRKYTLLREIHARPSYSRANTRLPRSHEKYRSTSHRLGCGMNTFCPSNFHTITNRYPAPAAVMSSFNVSRWWLSRGLGDEWRLE